MQLAVHAASAATNARAARVASVAGAGAADRVLELILLQVFASRADTAASPACY